MSPKSVARKGSKPIEPTKDEDYDPAEGHEDIYQRTDDKVAIKPDNQLKLTEAELKEELTRVLTIINPHAPQNVVRWNFKESRYKPVLLIEHLTIHISIDCNLIHRDSDEGKIQLSMQDEDFDIESVSSMTTSESEAYDRRVNDEEEEEEEEEVDDFDDDDSISVVTSVNEEEPDMSEIEEEKPKTRGKKEKKLTNQFNFCEHAAQTMSNPLRDKGVATEPVPRANISCNVTQWEIYDTYQEDFAQKEKAKVKKGTAKEAKPAKKTMAVGEATTENFEAMAMSMKVMERLINQNIFDDISQDFAYYEDPSDEFRETEGTLLPLWKFTFDKVKKMAVTALSWSSLYVDLIAVGHGSYEFLNQAGGLLLFYTLKNPAYPEFILNTTSGITSLHVHPDYAHLVVIGFYDGNVGIYDIIENKDALAYTSSLLPGKHTEPVWNVRWQADDQDGNLNFCSLSSDGRIMSWTLRKNNLDYRDVIHLTQDDLTIHGPDGTQLPTMGSGITFDWHLQKKHIFIVGTEEGKVHVCSKFYSDAFIDTYDAHHMSIYRIEWNRYHKNVFITCSADWTVKVWDRTSESREPVFTFDLGCAVGDVAWAPYSSTVFAAITTDGRVCVYDLAVNRFVPICDQLVVTKMKTKLTHVAFNPIHPVIVTGDDRGGVAILKLSPNLRRKRKEKKGQDPGTITHEEYEYQKLEKILTMARQSESKSTPVIIKESVAKL